MEEIIYTENEIFDIAYWIMNQGFCLGMEAADIQDELFNANKKTLPDCNGYVFTMEEDEDEE